MTNPIVDEYRVMAFDKAVDLTLQYPWFTKKEDDIFTLAERIYKFFIIPEEEKNND